jgi:hypothetical protein
MHRSHLGLVTAGYADPRTDVYSAGIVLFETLGRRTGNRLRLYVK